jgi:hypothetical protein
VYLGPEQFLTKLFTSVSRRPQDDTPSNKLPNLNCNKFLYNMVRHSPGCSTDLECLSSPEEQYPSLPVIQSQVQNKPAHNVESCREKMGTDGVNKVRTDVNLGGASAS